MLVKHRIRGDEEAELEAPPEALAKSFLNKAIAEPCHRLEAWSKTQLVLGFEVPSTHA